MPQRVPRTAINVRLPADEADDLKALATSEGATMSDVVRDAVRAHVARSALAGDANAIDLESTGLNVSLAIDIALLWATIACWVTTEELNALSQEKRRDLAGRVIAHVMKARI
jgi:hypothetical protein